KDFWNRVMRFQMSPIKDRRAPLFVVASHKPNPEDGRCCSMKQTAPLNLSSSGPVIPHDATARAGSLSTRFAAASHKPNPEDGRCCSMKQTAPLNLSSSGPVIPHQHHSTFQVLVR